MISFQDTEIAFKRFNDKELKRAHRMFRMMGNPFMLSMGKVGMKMVRKLSLPVDGIIKGMIYEHFVGGEDIMECRQTMRKLAQDGIGSILDYSVEGKKDQEQFRHTTQEIVRTIEEAGSNEHIPFAVFKLTGISRFSMLAAANESEEELNGALRSEYEQMLVRVDTIARRSFELGVPLFIDAEESWIQDTIDRVTHLMMERYNKEKAIVYNTAQMYRHDRLQFLKDQVQIARDKGYHYGVKLVRGAYMEKERERAEDKGYTDPIQPDKASCDRDYNLALELVLENIEVMALCAGTHNEASSLTLTKLMEGKGIEKTDQRVYFAQLLGMSDHISFNLSHHGYNVAKYVPYGPVKEVIPYLIRRAEENSSVAGQSGRELTLIENELARRKEAVARPTITQ